MVALGVIVLDEFAQEIAEVLVAPPCSTAARLQSAALLTKDSRALEEGHGCSVERKRSRFCFHPDRSSRGESPQFFFRAVEAGFHVVQIQFYYFAFRPLADVLDVEAHADLGSERVVIDIIPPQVQLEGEEHFEHVGIEARSSTSRIGCVPRPARGLHEAR